MAVRLHRIIPYGMRRRLHKLLCRVPYYYDYFSKRQLKQRQKARPKPLAPRMKHQNLSSVAINPSLNANCGLLTKLPIEIRLQIYAEVFASFDAYRSCTITLDGRLVTVPLCCCECLPTPRIHPNRHPNRLAISKTCRQIYIESIPTLYQQHLFRLLDLDTLVSLSRTVLPHRFATIRHLLLNFYVCYPSNTQSDMLSGPNTSEVWKIVATQMTGLRELKLFIFQHSHVEMNEGTEASERETLEGLLDLRGLKVFKLRFEHAGLYDDGVDRGRGARAFRKYLRRMVCRPRLGVGEVEEELLDGELTGESIRGSGESRYEG